MFRQTTRKRTQMYYISMLWFADQVRKINVLLQVMRPRAVGSRRPNYLRPRQVLCNSLTTLFRSGSLLNVGILWTGFTTSHVKARASKWYPIRDRPIKDWPWKWVEMMHSTTKTPLVSHPVLASLYIYICEVDDGSTPFSSFYELMKP